MRERRLTAVLLMVVALAMTLAGCADSGSGGYTGRTIDPPFVVPAVSLTDNTGADFTLATDERDLDIVFFGYTNCPDICKFVMSQLTSAYLRLSDEDRTRVRVVFVTTDPARDDPETLTSYLERYHSDFVGLTGTMAQLQELAKPLGVYFAKGQKLASGGYAVEHDSHVYAVTGDQARLLWSADTSATHIAADITRLLDDEAT